MRIALARNWGMIAVAAFLILTGLSQFGLHLPGIIMAVVAIAAGVLILIGR